MRVCEVWPLGQVSYREAWALQDRLVQQRSQQPGTPDRLLLLEHPHTYTLGTSGHDRNLLLTEAELAERGIEVHHIDRGGDITYHGPGQLVVYPILQFPRGEEGLRTYVTDYVRGLEQVVIDTLSDFGIVGRPVPGLPGVWVQSPAGEQKVCALGVRINVKAVTKHGFALNINTDLAYFKGIIPCGIQDKGVTSMARLLGQPVDEDRVRARVIAHFGTMFGCEMISTAAENLANLPVHPPSAHP